MGLEKRFSVCFFGPDGSGKSTLARFLAGHYSSMGFKTGIAWLRGTHTLASLIARLISRFKAFRGPCNPYYNICIPESFKYFWAVIEFFSLIPVLITRFILPKILGRIVIGERGLLDFLVWLIITLRWPGVVGCLVGRIILSLNKKVCRSIYIRASLEVLCERRKGFPEQDLLPLQLIAYDLLASSLGVPVVDTSKTSVRESFKKLLEVVGDKK